jgi:alpha-D-ribose 1-methylphosphonate 5-triphosphate diphosphatase
MHGQPCVEHRILPDAIYIKNAAVVTPEEVMKGASVTLGNGLIERIGGGRAPAGARVLDAAGTLLFPGFVDIHSDAIETAIQPRPGGRFPISMALRELDRALVAYGITTMFHSLSFCDNLQTGLRNSDQCSELIRLVNTASGQLRAKTRIHLRFEITETQAMPIAEGLIKDRQVHFFSLMDHTPGQGQFVDEEQFRQYYGKVRGKTEEELDNLIDLRIKVRQHVDIEALSRLAKLCQEMGLGLASHDDDTEEKVQLNQQLGVGLSEFPVTLEAARAARRCGMHISFGAPNIIRGGSATGNLSAREAILDGCGSIICSDYAPMAMVHAGMTLVQQGVLDLVKMSHMLSLNPAQATGIDDTTGSIEEGKAADLVLIDMDEGYPQILHTFVAGRQVYASC